MQSEIKYATETEQPEKNSNNTALNAELLKEHQLEVKKIYQHHKRIMQVLSGEGKTTIPILDTCNTENGSIISWEKATNATSTVLHQCLQKLQIQTMPEWRENHLITCIPAAGAASRFFKDIHKFVLHLQKIIPDLNELYSGFLTENDNKKIITNEIKNRIQKHLHSEKLPENIAKFCHNISEIHKETANCFYRYICEILEINNTSTFQNELNILRGYSITKTVIEQFSSLPKALVPTTKEGDSFLILKLVEQLALLPCLGNILVVPAKMKKDFEQKIEDAKYILQENVKDITLLKNTPFCPHNSKMNTEHIGQWTVLEQGRELSTIRFNMDGSPFIDDNQKYSPIPAGHGELIFLFDNIVNKFPNAECLHIRNIDNIIGSSSERITELSVPTEIFKTLRDFLEYMRPKVEDLIFADKKKSQEFILMDETVYKILSYISQFLPESTTTEALNLCFNDDGSFRGVHLNTIHKIFGNFFHWQPLPQTKFEVEAWQKTLEWLEHPLSLFAVVQKELHDTGGGPVIAKLIDGSTVKLCMEMPHASEEDSQEYFGSEGKATHFNPVLTFFELRTNKRSFENTSVVGKKVNFNKLFDERFWLLSKREYKGKPVCYHETVMYELIGNSATTNLVFIEVPRTLFRPHKSFFDSLNKDRQTYGFDETLATTKSRRD